MRRRTEILNCLEDMVNALYEVDHHDAQYFEEIIGKSSTRESFINSVAMSILEVKHEKKNRNLKHA